ncbi:hypothetical protein HX866_04070 [Pseudomonas gingeri]|uniref:phage tail tip lysozyme n=1 Tax=Pseudomonas gingeri TaxID=117681 RepID=UPI00159FA365|nr:phage tail tip lysozyme [Pseudomonas gingeri]NWA24059.1 hypothetical protein [Pseudomonas gingeri]
MPDFKIVISAVDKATATFRKVNDGVSRLTRPFEEVGKSFKSLGRELGFERIGKNLTTIGREAGGAARSVGMIVAPMAALTGVGTVAGIAALANNWANLGRSIDNSARGIGISTGQLQSFQGAAKMVGIDAGTTTASMDSLATTMQDAQWGRNQGALLMLNKLGIGLKKTKDGAWDVVGQYKAIANAVAGQKSPQVQALIANNLGLGGMLPFLREGAAGIEQYEDTVRRLGYVMSDSAVKQGKEFSKSLAGLNIAVDGTKNAIGDKLIPIMKPLIDQFTNWLATNRELIATNIADWAKGFATWINKIDWKEVGDGIINFGKGVGKLVDWLGGWENAALLVVGVMNAGLIAGVISLGVTLVTGGAGILSFIGILWQWQAAATATAAAQGALTASSAAGFLGKAGFVGAAGAAGYGAGTLINDHFVQGTKFQGWLGDKIARGLAFFGNDEAKQAVATTDISNGVIPGGRDKSTSVSKFFEDHGWTKAQASGIAVNLGAESNFDPSAYGDGGRAYGLGQWHQDRQQAFAKWAGKSIHGSSVEEQLGFVQYELTQGAEKSAGDQLRGAKTASEAGEIVSRKYERPAAADWEAARRGKLAEMLSNPAPDGPYTQGAAQGAGSGGKIQVDVNLKGAPEGTTAKVKAQGNTQASSRIAYNGVGAIA